MVAVFYRVLVLTVDRATEVEALTDTLLEHLSRAGGLRARLEVTRDARVVDRAHLPGEPSTVAVVLSAGPATAQDADVHQAIRSCEMRFIPVLPVVTHLGRVADQCPEPLRPINAMPWQRGDPAGPLANALLRLLAINEDDRRIFLSHAREDGSALAEQLRLALNDERWDVFLDRFSIPPAEKFQKRLEQELADKAFVLLLETPAAKGRHWVDREVAIAERHKLGLMGLTMPSTDVSQRFSALDDAFRRELTWGELEASADHSGSDREGGQRLTQPALDDVVLDIELGHARASRLRRQSVLEDATSELRALGYQVGPLDEWSLLAERGEEREVVLVTARAPMPADLRRADDLRRPHRRMGTTTRGWVVHPTDDIDRDRADLLRWLSRHRAVKPTPLMLLRERVGR